MQRDDSLRRQITEALAAFERAEPAEPGQRAAAVAVTIIDEGHGADLPGLPLQDTWSERAAFILTRRAGDLRRHAGQWALPGGRLDEGETAEQAALRELAEEVDLHLGPEAVLGRLDDFVSRSGFSITPVVVWGGAARELRPNPEEVGQLHRIPVTELVRPDAPYYENMTDNPAPVMRMPLGQSRCAAPTAAILLQFREVCLLGRQTRVGHIEQPRFAWK